MIAFLDSEARVVALGQAEDSWNLARIQEERPDVGAVEEIHNAPEGLFPYIDNILLLRPIDSTYHKKVSGDGTSIGDYEEISELRILKIQKQEEIYARNWELYEGPNGLGMLFRDSYLVNVDAPSQLNIIGFQLLASNMTFPYQYRCRDLKGKKTYCTMESAADLAALFAAAATRKLIISMSGESLEASVEAATTPEEIEAIVDTRTFEDFQ